jgi:hypothetical protein
MARAREGTTVQKDHARAAAARAAEQADGQVNGWSARLGLVSQRGRRDDEDVLRVVLEAAGSLVDHRGSVSVTTVDQLGDQRPPWRTAAATGEAASLDEAQYVLAEGPLVEAVELDMLVAVTEDDLARPEAERTWPRLSLAVEDLGVRSVLSVGLPWSPLRVGVHPEAKALGAVTSYAAEPHAFVRRRQHRATLLGCWAAALMSGREPAEIRREGE